MFLSTYLGAGAHPACNGQSKLWKKREMGGYVREMGALIKKKINLSSSIRKFRGIGCKVIYD
jgi:hypothetical protein